MTVLDSVLTHFPGLLKSNTGFLSCQDNGLRSILLTVFETEAETLILPLAFDLTDKPETLILPLVIENCPDY
jgi:hypothetical protein